MEQMSHTYITQIELLNVMPIMAVEKLPVVITQIKEFQNPDA